MKLWSSLWYLILGFRFYTKEHVSSYFPQRQTLIQSGKEPTWNGSLLSLHLNKICLPYSTKQRNCFLIQQYLNTKYRRCTEPYLQIRFIPHSDFGLAEIEYLMDELISHHHYRPNQVWIALVLLGETAVPAVFRFLNVYHIAWCYDFSSPKKKLMR